MYPYQTMLTDAMHKTFCRYNHIDQCGYPSGSWKDFKGNRDWKAKADKFL